MTVRELIRELTYIDDWEQNAEVSLVKIDDDRIIRTGKGVAILKVESSTIIVIEDD